MGRLRLQIVLLGVPALAPLMHMVSPSFVEFTKATGIQVMTRRIKHKSTTSGQQVTLQDCKESDNSSCSSVRYSALAAGSLAGLFACMAPYRTRRKTQCLAATTKTVVHRMPRHTKLGDVAVLPESASDVDAKALELLQLPDVRSVAVKEHNGAARFVAGDPSLNITYKEDGVRFHLDLARRVSRLSRCQGGSGERQRLKNLVKSGERILVLGSGIGITPCYLGALTPCSEVVGLEPEPVAHEFASENITLNRLDGVVRSVVGDPMDAETLQSLGKFDRVCAFLPWHRDGVELPLSTIVAPAVSVVSPGGTLHAYACETQSVWESGPAQAESQMKIACGNRSFELLWRERVPRKSIGPFVFRVGMDFRID